MTRYIRMASRFFAVVRACLPLVFAVFGFLSTSSRVAGQCVPMAPGLVFWHPLDEVDTGVVGGQTSITVNGVGFENGRVRRAMAMGLAGSGMLVSLAETQVDLSSFTIEGWILRRRLGLSTTDGEGGVIFGGGPSSLVFALLSDGRLTLSAGGVSRVDSEAAIRDLQWHHVAVTRSGTTVRFYVDGVEGGLIDYPAVFAPSPTYGIGKFASLVLGLTGSFLGSLDEIAVYRGALSLGEIQAIYAAGESGKCRPEVQLSELFVVPRVAQNTEFVAECVIVPTGLTSVRDVEVQFSATSGLTILGGSASAGTFSLGTTSAVLRIPSLSVTTGSRVKVGLKSGMPGSAAFKVNIRGAEVARTVYTVPPCSDTDGVAGFWPLDGTGVDLIGGGIGTLRSGARFVEGRGGIGRALEVDGNADALVVANPQTLGLDVFSLEMWMRRGSLDRTTQNGIAGIIAAGTDGSFSVGLSPEGNLLFSQVAVVLGQIPARIQDLAWHHLVMVREVGAIAFYLDGTLAGRVNFSGTFGPSTAFAIGSLPVPSFGYNYGFVGTIDDFTVWNRRLGAVEIQARASSASASFCSADVSLQLLEGTALISPETTNRFAWRLRNTGAIAAEGVVLRNVWSSVLGVSGAETTKGSVELAADGLRVEVGRMIPGESVDVVLTAFPKGSGVALLSSKVFAGSAPLTPMATNDTFIDVGVTCASPIAGLEALYRGDGDLKDATGRHPGVQENSLGFGAGRVREAFAFTGEGGVAVPDSGWLNRQDFTVDAWVYPTAYTGREDIIVNRELNAASLETIQFEMGIRGPLDPVGTIPVGNLAVFVSGLSGMPNNHNGWTDAGATVPLNRWSHVAMAVEPGRVRVFLNGVKVSEFVGLTGTIPSMDAPFRIGARSQTFPGWEADRFDGWIDEVGVYTRSLLNGEVTALFAAGAAGRCDADLRLSWLGVPGTLAAGESFLARLVVENVGNQPLATVTLTNTVPAGWTVTALTTSVGTVTWNAGTVTGELGILSAGAQVTVDLVIQANAAQEGSLVARGYSQTAELSSANNTAQVSVVVIPLTVSVLDAQRTEGGIGERLILPVPVRLSAPVSRTVSVEYVTGPPRPGTGQLPAVAGVDFEAVTGRLEFAPGEVEKTVPIVLLGDAFYERDEVFGLILSNPVGMTLEGLLPVLTILNDDALPRVSVADARIVEGNSGTKDLVFPVTMVGLAAVDLEIAWATTNETARSPFDFAGGTGTVVIPSGTTAAEIRIPVVGDPVEEPNEYFTLRLSASPTAATSLVFGKGAATGTILNDDQSAGVVRGFEWVTPPAAVAGQPFGAQLRAVDGRGAVVSNFNGVVALAGVPTGAVGGNGLPSQLLITEVDTQSIDGVEFQNVSSGDLDISGWRVSFYDHTRWPVPRGTFVIPTGTVIGAGRLFWIQEGSSFPNAFPRFGLGQNLDWGVDTAGAILTTRPVAVMLQDASGTLRDFFAASGAEPGQIDIPLTVEPSEWPGFPLGGMNVLTATFTTYQRVGWWNQRGAQAWARGRATILSQNNRIRAPFVDGRLTSVAPSVLATFSDGAWVGTLTLNPPSGSVRLLADDGSGRLGVSAGVSFASPGDLRIASFESASPFVVRSGELSFRLVVTNGAPTAASGVMLEIPLDNELGLNRQGFTVLKASQGTVSFVPPGPTTRPRGTILADIGTVAPGGVVTVEVVARRGTLPGRSELTMVAEVRRTGGVGGAGFDWAELPLELVDGLVQGRPGRLAWWRAEGDARDTFGAFDGVASGVRYTRRFDQQAFSFDGEQAVVEVAAGAASKVSATAGLGVGAWVRPRPGQRERQVVFELSGGTNGVGLTFLLRNGKPSIEWDGQWIGMETGAPDLRDDDWHYVTWTLSPAQSLLEVRIDRGSGYTVPTGVLVDVSKAGGGPLRIGRGAGGGGFDGEIDEVTLYGSAQATGSSLEHHAAGALGQALSDARVTLTRVVTPIPPITVGRPYTLTLAATNFGPLRIPNLSFRWQNHTSAIISEIRRDGVPLPSTKVGNVDQAELGGFEPGQGSLLTVSFRVNRDIAQLSSVMTLFAGLRDRVSTLTFAANVLADPDGDGLPSNWEAVYGLDPADPVDALLDRDGDGFGARAEYDAGTDPTSADSFPSVGWRVSEGGALVLRVQTTVDRDYRLERTITLRGPAGWELLERRPGTGDVLEFVIPGIVAGEQSYFRVRPLPLW